MADEVESVATAFRAMLGTAQEVFAFVAERLEGVDEHDVQRVAREAALEFVERNKERVGEELLELGASLNAAGDMDEVALAVVDDDRVDGLEHEGDERWAK